MNTIEAHETNPEGSVERIGLYTAELFHPGSVILCRNTAPLVAFAYSLLKRDVPCRILGRDIGAQLITLVKKLRAANLEDLTEKLDVWLSREVERANKDDRSPDRLYDQADCIRFFIDSLDEDSRTVDSLLAKIELMFVDDTNGNLSFRVTLSTVHKAKGLEFATVFILDFDKYMPSKWAKQPWQRVQEMNLIYVAVTRAMERLVYINSDAWKE